MTPDSDGAHHWIKGHMSIGQVESGGGTPLISYWVCTDDDHDFGNEVTNVIHVVPVDENGNALADPWYGVCVRHAARYLGRKT